MALQVTSSSSNISGSMGQFVTNCCLITSDNSMTGLPINVNPALFANSPNQIPLTNSNQWIETYPSAPGTYPLNFVGGNTNKNHNISIEVIDDKNAKICIDFFFLSDLNGYISDTAYSNFNIFNQSPSGYLNLFIEVGGENVVCSTEVDVNEFCAASDISFEIQNEGFCPGEDLNICFTSSYLSGISNNFYVGFLNVSGINNNSPFEEDFNLSYGLVGGGISSVSDLENSCLKSGSGFISDGASQTKANVVIEGSCISEGSKYQIYIVYQKNGQWQSCISEPICQKSDANLPVIDGSVISCCVKDATGVTYNDCCLKNIAPCGSLEVCFKVNRAALEADFANAGLTGTIESYLSSCEIYESNTEFVSGLPTSPTKEINDEGVKFCSNIDVELNVGKKYYIGCIEFNYSKSTIEADNTIQRIYIPIEVEFSECVESDPTFVLEQEGVDPDLVEDCFCCGLDGVLFSNIGDNCFGFISKNGGSYIAYGDTSEINVSDLECDQRYCVKSICSEDPVIEEPCPCPKPCLDISYNYQVGFYNSATDTVLINFNLNSSGQTTITELVSGQTITGLSNNTTLEFPFSQPLYRIRIDYVAENGCEYDTIEIDLDQQQVLDTNGSGFMIGSGNQDDCDCPDECPTNNAWVDWDCSGGVLGYNINTDFGQTPIQTIDNTENTLDSDGNLIAASIYVRYIFEGCPDVVIQQVLTCDEDDICINNRSLSLSINENCELVIDSVDNINSPIQDNTLYVNINGNTQIISNPTFPQSYPISNGQTYDVWSIVNFSDGCPQLQTPNNPQVAVCAVSDCEFEPCTFICEADEENCLINWTLTCPEGVTGSVLFNEKYPLIGASGSIPYQGSGAFLITSSKTGCPDIIRSAFCLIKPKTCCDEIECNEFGPIVCNSKVMSFEINGETNGYSYQWCDPNNVELGTGLTQEVSIDGIYTLKVTAPEGCDDLELTYNFEGGEAGIGGSGTVVKQ